MPPSPRLRTEETAANTNAREKSSTESASAATHGASAAYVIFWEFEVRHGALRFRLIRVRRFHLDPGIGPSRRGFQESHSAFGRSCPIESSDGGTPALRRPGFR